MTLGNVFHKLRQVNNLQYRQFWGCLMFANVLVSSFAAVLFSSFIQSTLPKGGDSRKQYYFIFGVAVVGCFVFILYAMGLFLRHKSREVGIFLALGTDKRKLTKAVLGEISSIACSAAISGILVGNVIAFMIGKIFETIAVEAEKKVFTLSFIGIVLAAIFALLVFFCLVIMSASFMKRSNIIEIINEQRRSEPIKQELSDKYLLSGIILCVLGFFLATVFPILYVNIFKQYLSSVFYLFYLLCIVGLYRVLAYSIVVHKRGKNPQKYYKNLISYGILKFQGISMVRNMALIMLLILGALYASFYIPSNALWGIAIIQQNPADVSYRIPESSEIISEQDVNHLAEEYGQRIQNYREIEFMELLSSAVEKDRDESGKLIEIYQKEAYYRQFVSVAEMNEKMGINMSVDQGTYKAIIAESMTPSIIFTFDDLDYVQNQETGIGKELKFAGTAIFNELIVHNGWDSVSRFILNDKDYEELQRGVAAEHIIRQILFNVKDLESSYEFSKALFKEYCLKADETMKVASLYDSYLEQKAAENEEEYVYAQRIDLQPERPELELNWKFAPYFKILSQKNMLLPYAVQMMLFAYVAIVMLASVGIIAFTRSQSIGLQNKQVYEDVRKLGGDNAFILRCIKSQIKKVYFLPTVVALSIIYPYQILIFFQNEGRFQKFEMTAALIDLGLCFVVAVFQYICYRISLKEVKKIVNI